MLSSFFKLLSRCYRLALPYGRVKLFAVLGLIFFNGLLQLIGVSSVFPFFALAADPDRIRRSSVGAWFLSCLPPMSSNHLLVVAGCFAILMLLVSSGGSLLSDILRNRYGYGFANWLRSSLFNSYANQPYSFFLKRNSAELNQRILDIFVFVQMVMLPLGEVLSKSVIIILLVAGLFLVQPWVAIGALVLFGGFYYFVLCVIRPRAQLISNGLEKSYVGFSKKTFQFLHGIKTILVNDKTRVFTDEAMSHSYEIGRLSSMLPIFTNTPRYLVEPIAFGGLVAVVIVMALQGRPFADILPNLSVMALAGYRLLPALQGMYSALVNIAAHHFSLSKLEGEILEIENEVLIERPGSTSLSAPLTLNHSIKLADISFTYEGGSSPTIKSLNLIINKNESIGIAGASGSGKSTLVDLILGLHTPATGQILFDGTPLSKNNMSSWRSMIGYVPQDIYLMDETIAENIAFGIEPSSIDHEALRKAALGAQILDFIERELPEGFQTVVGERGVRLSGGQRQRIGLARALYHNPQILILDEATSALDQQTEAAVMETIHKLQGKVTIISIAHRTSTLEKCDRIEKI